MGGSCRDVIDSCGVLTWSKIDRLLRQDKIMISISISKNLSDI